MIKPTKAQMRIIKALQTKGPMSAKKLAEESGISAATVRQFANFFHFAGVIDIKIDSVDHRSRVIYLKHSALKNIEGLTANTD